MSEKEFRLGGDLIGTMCRTCRGAGWLPAKKKLGDQWHEYESPCHECKGIGWNLTHKGKTLVHMIKNTVLADEYFNTQLELDPTEITRPGD